MSVTTQHHSDYVAVPRRLASDICKALDYLEGVGPMHARDLRPFLTTPPRREVALAPRERFTELVRFARKVNDDVHGGFYPPSVVDAVLASWAPDATRDQFDDLCEAVGLYEGIESGELDWAHEYPDLRHVEHHVDDKAEIARQWAAEAMHARAWELVHPGERRCVDCVKRPGGDVYPQPALRGRDVCGPCNVRREITFTRKSMDNNVIPLGRPA